MTTQTLRNNTQTTICTCDHFAPELRVVRSVPFNAELAAFYAGLGLSGEGVIDWVMTELYDYRAGTLYDFDDQPIDLDLLDANGLALLDAVWGVDPGRFINRYLERMRRMPTNRLKRGIVLPVLILHYARQIHQCRTSGGCAERARVAS